MTEPIYGRQLPSDMKEVTLTADSPYSEKPKS
jgi:hypothetical protein